MTHGGVSSMTARPNAVPTAEELIGRFSRCPKFPDTEMGVLYLAEGLRSAANSCGVSMASIVEKCAMSSRFCPTDYDLLTVASEIRAECDRLETERSEPVWKWHTRCGSCDGSGWQSFTTSKGYDSARRCPRGCNIPNPSGYMLTPEKLR